ncbi:Uncharacterised protein [Vibrio cholerae]|nr:Uncharacterised protein [Vibrio cholerae]
MIDRATSSSERGSWAASNSRISSFFGFSTMSRTVANRPTSSRSLSRPCCCNSSSERPRLVGSFGTAMRAPSCSSSTDLICFE